MRETDVWVAEGEVPHVGRYSCEPCSNGSEDAEDDVSLLSEIYWRTEAYNNMIQSKTYENTSFTDILVALRREAIADLMMGAYFDAMKIVFSSERNGEVGMFVVVIV